MEEFKAVTRGTIAVCDCLSIIMVYVLIFLYRESGRCSDRDQANLKPWETFFVNPTLPD